jgi:hypothetical protein
LETGVGRHHRVPERLEEMAMSASFWTTAISARTSLTAGAIWRSRGVLLTTG